jgi:hypothetical protein
MFILLFMLLHIYFFSTSSIGLVMKALITHYRRFKHTIPSSFKDNYALGVLILRQEISNNKVSSNT